MRSLNLAIGLSLSLLTFAQQDTARQHRHELGLDFTNFFGNYLGFNTAGSGSLYVPAYMVTYRHHFRHWNIRAAVGGDLSRTERPTSFDFGPENYASERTEVYLRIGAERFSELGRRWQVYYGLDLRPSWLHVVEDAVYWNGGYSNGEEVKGRSFGIAPLMGVRFRLTPRFSLTTEASWGLQWINNESRKYYAAVIEGYPDIPDVTTKSSSLISSFQPPFSVIATFDL